MPNECLFLFLSLNFGHASHIRAIRSIYFARTLGIWIQELAAIPFRMANRYIIIIINSAYVS